MKHNFIKPIIFVLLITGFSSCSKKIDEYYTDPDKTTSANMGQLFTYMLHNNRIYPTYWDYATFVTGVTANYSQFIATSPSSNMYVPNTSYNQDRWEDYYTGGIMNSYRTIVVAYNNMSDYDKNLNYIFLQLAKVILYDQTSQIIDLWGDIPYSEAGSLNTTNLLSNAKFDDAATIYYSLIDSLTSLNTYLASASIASSTKTALTTQDLLLGGDLTLWRKYVNSLKLRLLMRISNYDESSAKTEVTKILTDESTYPMVSSNSENILLEMNPSSGSYYSEGIRAGLTDGATSDGPYAPYYMLDSVMFNNNDPRTPVFWDAGPKSLDSLGVEYLGVKINDNSETVSLRIKDSLLTTYDTTTFIYNLNVPGVLFTASEVSFLKAEAYERWSSIGGNAQTAYETGIKQSIEFYYSLNQESYKNTSYTYTAKILDSPAASVITAFLSSSEVGYSGTTSEKLAKIYTQKWVNFFILQAGQAWAEYRRTGYPDIPFVKDPLTGVLPPTRLLYPDTEKSYNSTNYSAVSSKDTRDTKIFWDVN
jgi:hypothetical protein